MSVPREVGPLAQIVTAAHEAEDRVRQAAGCGVVAAGACLAVLSAIPLTAGVLQGVTVAVAVSLFVTAIGCFSQASVHRRQAEGEQAVVRALAAGLPAHWYILSDIHLTPIPGEPDEVCIVVVAPGALIVIRTCCEGGNLVPAGSVWMTGRGRGARMIPSPAAACHAAAEALRGLLTDADSLPVIPLVALTAPDGVYYPSRADAHVVGVPYVARAVGHCGSGKVLAPDAAHRLAMDLCQFYR